MPVHEPRYVESSSGLVQPWALLSSRWFLNLLSRGGREARLSIFVYHRVLPRPDVLFPDEGDAEAFDRHIKKCRIFVHPTIFYGLHSQLDKARSAILELLYQYSARGGH